MSERVPTPPNLTLPPGFHQHLSTNLNGAELTVAIVAARFNYDITSALLTSCLERLEKLQVPRNKITITSVPGSYEIPLVAKLISKQTKSDVTVSLGAIIKGETDHYHFVARQVAQSIAQVNLELNIPLIFGVITCDTYEQAAERVKLGSLYADAAVEMGNKCLAIKKSLE